MFTTAMGALNGTSYLNSAFDTGWLPGEQEDLSSPTLKKPVTVEYVAANQMAIRGLDWRDRIQQGTKIRYKQGSGYKYDFVLSATANTDTTLTLMGGSTVENETITDFAYSNIANPIGWPFGVDYIEGSNDNGTWEKYVDGTLECWGTKTFTSVAVTDLWGGGIYISPPEIVTWPISFAVIESANINVIARTPDSFVPVSVEFANQYQGNFYFWKPASFTYDSITVGFYAKGRWQ